MRPVVLKPRMRGFVHRPIISIVNGTGMTESGEVVKNLPLFAYNSEPHIWVTTSPVDLARTMKDHFGTYAVIKGFCGRNIRCYEYPWFCLGANNSVDPDPDARQLGPPKGRITSFGFHTKYCHAPHHRKSARHLICHPMQMFGNRKRANDIVDNNHASLQKFMQDVREWCSEQDIPLGKTLSSIGGALLRDKRFWPDARGQVPKATNEKIRPYLPAVDNQLYVDTHRVHANVVALDQRRAYHTIAQEVDTPDPTTLFARGYFHHPVDAKIWTKPGRIVYERTVNQPGLLAVRGSSRPTRIGEIRLPCLDFSGTKVVYIWSNELELAKRQGFSIEGLTAAWTSRDADSGLPKYGKWAIEQINKSSPYRQKWLKPTLHSTYGLLGARMRTMEFLEYIGKSDDIVEWYFAGFKFRFHRRLLESWLPPFANTAMLGTLQAEVRQRTLSLAMDLSERGAVILHTHADGLHVEIDQLPLDEVFSGNRWTADKLTHLIYEDGVSYISNEKLCLPGRDTRTRIETRRHYARLIQSKKQGKQCPTNSPKVSRNTR